MGFGSKAAGTDRTALSQPPAARATTPAEPRLQVRGLMKSYGETRVLQDVTVAFHGGEIHAVIGENGAGKSTLIRCCTGLVTPDAGELRVDGKVTRLRNLQSARDLGIR